MIFFNHPYIGKKPVGAMIFDSLLTKRFNADFIKDVILERMQLTAALVNDPILREHLNDILLSMPERLFIMGMIAQFPHDMVCPLDPKLFSDAVAQAHYFNNVLKPFLVPFVSQTLDCLHETTLNSIKDSTEIQQLVDRTLPVLEKLKAAERIWSQAYKLELGDINGAPLTVQISILKMMYNK
jgi:hypothetical protein